MNNLINMRAGMIRSSGREAIHPFIGLRCICRHQCWLENGYKWREEASHSHIFQLPKLAHAVLLKKTRRTI